MQASYDILTKSSDKGANQEILNTHVLLQPEPLSSRGISPVPPMSDQLDSIFRLPEKESAGSDIQETTQPDNAKLSNDFIKSSLEVKAGSLQALPTVLTSPHVRYLSHADREQYFSTQAKQGITGFFSGFFKTIAGMAGITVLTALTGSALVPFVGIPLLCSWLADKGGDELTYWAAKAKLGDRTAYTGIDQSALVVSLARQLQYAQTHNDALIRDMGNFLHHTQAIQTAVAATQHEKQLQKSLFKRFESEVKAQKANLDAALASDLNEARITIINTNGGAYVGGNVNAGGNFIGHDQISNT